MARFIKGDVVVVTFPFSDLSNAKRRPALVIANLIGNDLILCQITSKDVSDTYAIALNETDFKTGSLNKPSNIRPNRIFTADSRIILYQVGKVLDAKIKEVTGKIIQIVQA
ncbi:MAG: type II toxin-antitoxin system PemK/MazF family toxin [Candidatus Lokiarchaeota archaeon]|nr:type II toxin-antitoxin system PemK/MazF family toxin [Candidatus Lokiarchaeota archaeon]